MNHTVVKEIVYDSFGNIVEDTDESFPVPFGFAGGLRDRDTGLVHFGFREYDPFTGRWTAKDPIGFAGGDTNLYGYVLNDPVNGVDPWGLFDPGAEVQPYFPNIPSKGDIKSWNDSRNNYGETPGLFSPEKLPYDPTFTCCKQYPQTTIEGSTLNLLCNDVFGTDPYSNCVRKCLSDYVGNRGENPPLDYYFLAHPECWEGCHWPGGLY